MKRGPRQSLPEVVYVTYPEAAISFHLKKKSEALTCNDMLQKIRHKCESWLSSSGSSHAGSPTVGKAPAVPGLINLIINKLVAT